MGIHLFISLKPGEWGWGGGGAMHPGETERRGVGGGEGGGEGGGADRRRAGTDLLIELYYFITQE